MDALELRQYDMMIRVRDFGQTQAALFPTGSHAAELFERVGAAVAALAALAARKNSRVGSARLSTVQKAGARAELTEALKSLTRSARVLALDKAGLENKFRLPARHTVHDLVAAANAFIADAEPLRADFIRIGLAADFIERLQGMKNAFEASLGERSAATESVAATNLEIDELIANGMDAVRRLDVVVRNQAGDRPAVMTAWLRASRVEHAGKPATAAAVQPPPVG